jgi:hypothetical protein
VVATVEALRGTALGPDLDLVEEVTAVDDRTVRFRLREPTVRWPLLPGDVGSCRRTSSRRAGWRRPPRWR